MDYTQNAKIAQVTEKSLVIGVDVGSGTHYARAFNWRGQELSKKAFSFGNELRDILPSPYGWTDIAKAWTLRRSWSAASRRDITGSTLYSM